MHMNTEYGLFDHNSDIFVYVLDPCTKSVHHQKTLFAFANSLLTDLENIMVHDLWLTCANVNGDASAISTEHRAYSIIKLLENFFDEHAQNMNKAEMYLCKALWKIYCCFAVKYFCFVRDEKKIFCYTKATNKLVIEGYLMQAKELLHNECQCPIKSEVEMLLIALKCPNVTPAALQNYHEKLSFSKYSHTQYKISIRIFLLLSSIHTEDPITNLFCPWLNHALKNLDHISLKRSYRSSLLDHLHSNLEYGFPCPTDQSIIKHCSECHGHIFYIKNLQKSMFMLTI